MLVAATRLTRAPAGVVVGMLAGLQTQPAVLAGEQEPSLGYALVYPFAMVSKILLAQLLVMLL